MNSRAVFVGNDVFESDDEFIYASVVSKILELNKQSHDPIILVITSFGGCIENMLTLVDLMRGIESPVHTQILGCAYSAAAIVAACGEKGHRYAAPNARILLHQPSRYGLSGTINDIAIAAKDLDNVSKQLVKILSECSNAGTKQLEKLIDRDAWLSVEETMKFSLIDVVGIHPELGKIDVPTRTM